MRVSISYKAIDHQLFVFRKYQIQLQTAAIASQIFSLGHLTMSAELPAPLCINQTHIQLDLKPTVCLIFGSTGRLQTERLTYRFGDLIRFNAASIQIRKDPSARSIIGQSPRERLNLEPQIKRRETNRCYRRLTAAWYIQIDIYTLATSCN
jgi:hypothetical protein